MGDEKFPLITGRGAIKIYFQINGLTLIIKDLKSGIKIILSRGQGWACGAIPGRKKWIGTSGNGHIALQIHGQSYPFSSLGQ